MTSRRPAASASTGRHEQRRGVAGALASGGNTRTEGGTPWNRYRRNQQTPIASNTSSLLLPASVPVTAPRNFACCTGIPAVRWWRNAMPLSTWTGAIGEGRVSSRAFVCCTNNGATEVCLQYNPRYPAALRQSQARVDVNNDSALQGHRRVVGMPI